MHVKFFKILQICTLKSSNPPSVQVEVLYPPYLKVKLFKVVEFESLSLQALPLKLPSQGRNYYISLCAMKLPLNYLSCDGDECPSL